MANITTCTKCGGLFEAGSEELANEPVRLCFGCRPKTAPLPTATFPPTSGGGLFSSPTPPPPTRCPSCGIVEITAVCRWCGCWKFSKAGIDAAFRNILAGKFWKVAGIAAAMALNACTVISHKPPPADWPELKVVERCVSDSEVLKACYRYLPTSMKLMGGVPLACAVVDFPRRRCDVTYRCEEADPEVLAHTLEHERDHCAGKDHVGDDTLGAAWRAYREAGGR